MTITRSALEPYVQTDWLEQFSTMPKDWGILNKLGLFEETPAAAHNVTFEEVIETGGVLVDAVRGDRNQTNKVDKKRMHNFLIPHFPNDDVIYPSDLSEISNLKDVDLQEGLAGIVARRIKRLTRKHLWTWETARWQALRLGTAYSPNGTISHDYYAEFGVTPTTVTFNLSSSSEDVNGKVEQVIAAIDDNSGDVSRTRIIGLCGTTFFNALIAHPKTINAFQNYSSDQEPLRQRLGGDGTQNRMFDYLGILFIECRDKYGAQPLLPVADAVFFPLGTDAFMTFMGPCHMKFSLLNKLGQAMYIFPEMKDDLQFDIKTESNHLHMIRKPGLVIRGTAT